MINNLINKGNVNEQLMYSHGYFSHYLIPTNGKYYCTLFFIHYN